MEVKPLAQADPVPFWCEKRVQSCSLLCGGPRAFSDAHRHADSCTQTQPATSLTLDLSQECRRKEWWPHDHSQARDSLAVPKPLCHPEGYPHSQPCRYIFITNLFCQCSPTAQQLLLLLLALIALPRTSDIGFAQEPQIYISVQRGIDMPCQEWDLWRAMDWIHCQETAGQNTRLS